MNNKAEQLDWVDKLARHIEQRGASSLALLLITIARPFGFLGSQALFITQPLLTGLIDNTAIEQAAVLLDSPELLNRLSATLERVKPE